MGRTTENVESELVFTNTLKFTLYNYYIETFIDIVIICCLYAFVGIDYFTIER